MADSVGKIKLDIDLSTGIDKQLKAASANIGKRLSDQVSGIIDKTVKRQSDAMKKMTAFKMPKSMQQQSTAISDGNNRLQQELENINARIDIHREKLRTLKEEYAGGIDDKINHQIREQEQIMQISETRIEALRLKLKELKFSYENAVSPERKNKLIQEIAKTEAQMQKLVMQSDKALYQIVKLEKGMDKAARTKLRENIVKTEGSLIALGNRAERVRNQMQGMDNQFKRTGGSASKASNAFSAAFSRIAKQVFVFAMIYKAIRGFQDYMGGALMTNNQFANSLAQVRLNLQAAFMPIFEAVLPALNSFMSWLAKATAYVASFISVLFGSTYKKSIQAAQGINVARQSLNNFGGSAKKAGKDAKDLKKQLGDLAGFDELNILNRNDLDGPGGIGGVGQPSGIGGGGVGGIGDLDLPYEDLSKFEEKVKKLQMGTIKRLAEMIIKARRKLYDFIALLALAILKVIEYWKTVKDKFSLVTRIISLLTSHTVKKFKEKWNSIKDNMASIGKKVPETWNKIKNKTSNFVGNMVSGVKNKFTEKKDAAIGAVTALKIGAESLYNRMRTSLVNKANEIKTKVAAPFAALRTVVQTTISNLKTGLDTRFNNIRSSLVNKASEIRTKITTPFNTARTNIQNTITNLRTGATSRFNALRTSLVNTANNIRTRITTPFNNARNAIQNTFTNLRSRMGGIWSGIYSTIRGYINRIISGINRMIGGMNRLRFSAPSWVPGIGGRSWGINIPRIPMLAKGGIVDAPTLAMIGEGADNEAVLPLNNSVMGQLAGMISENMSGGGGHNDDLLNKILEVLTLMYAAMVANNGNDVVLKLNETELGRAVIKAINNLNKQAGKQLLDI